MYEQEQVAEALRYSEVGGGEGYDPDDRVTPEDADVIVESADALHDECAKPGQTVYIGTDTTIFLDRPLYLERDVTLAGNRDANGAQLITAEKGTDSAASKGIIRSRKPGVRVSGIRLRGPVTSGGWIPSDDISENLAIGLRLHGDARIDNCRVWGFPYCGIRVGGRSTTPEVEIDHCHFHTFRQRGLGYCVDVVNGHSHIHHNWLDDARHHVCGFGFDTNSYTLEKNVLGPTALLHSVDMHCVGENFPDGSDFVTKDRDADGDPWYFFRAGGEVVIRRNTFAFRNYVSGHPAVAIAIRGEPRDRVWIDGNRFMHAEPPDENSGNNSQGKCWRQVNVRLGSSNVPTDDHGWTTNFEVGDNQFGAPATPWSPAYGAPIDLDNPRRRVPSDGTVSRREAVAIADALRELRDPLAELSDLQ